jgi:hypothetical protein
MEIEKKAIRMGAVAAGVSSIESLVKANAVDLDVLPSAKTVLAIACGHSRAALDSKNLQVKQYDTIATYEKVRKVCKPRCCIKMWLNQLHAPIKRLFLPFCRRPRLRPSFRLGERGFCPGGRASWPGGRITSPVE